MNSNDLRHLLIKTFENLAKALKSLDTQGPTAPLPIEDHSDIRLFLAEKTVKDPKGEVPYRDLHDALSVWCAARGQEPPTDTKFGTMLTALKFVGAKKTGGLRVRCGLVLR